MFLNVLKVHAKRPGELFRFLSMKKMENKYFQKSGLFFTKCHHSYFSILLICLLQSKHSKMYYYQYHLLLILGSYCCNISEGIQRFEVTRVDMDFESYSWFLINNRNGGYYLIWALFSHHTYTVHYLTNQHSCGGWCKRKHVN